MNLASVFAWWTDVPSFLSNGPLRMHAIYSVTSRSPSPEGPARLTLTSVWKYYALLLHHLKVPLRTPPNRSTRYRRRPSKSSRLLDLAPTASAALYVRTHTWHSEFLSPQAWHRDIPAWRHLNIPKRDGHIRTYAHHENRSLIQSLALMRSAIISSQLCDMPYLEVYHKQPKYNMEPQLDNPLGLWPSRAPGVT